MKVCTLTKRSRTINALVIFLLWTWKLQHTRSSLWLSCSTGMNPPSGIVKALNYICANCNAKAYSSRYHQLSIRFTRANPLKENSHRDVLFVPQQTVLSLTMVLKWFIQWFFVYTYLQRGKQPSRLKLRTSWCTQIFSALDVILNGFCLCSLKQQRGAPFRVLQLGARAASVLSSRWDKQGLSSWVAYVTTKVKRPHHPHFNKIF